MGPDGRAEVSTVLIPKLCLGFPCKAFATFAQAKQLYLSNVCKSEADAIHVDGQSSEEPILCRGAP